MKIVTWIFFTFILVLVFGIGGTIGTLLEKEKAEKSINVTSQPKTSPTPTPMDDYSRHVSKAVYDNSGNYFVYGETKKIDGKWMVVLMVDGQNSSYGKQDRVIYKKITDLDDRKINDVYNTVLFEAAWSSDDKKLAVVWKDIRFIWDVGERVDNPRELVFLKDYRGGLFFVRQKLFITADDGLYEIWPDFHLERERNSMEYGFSPLPDGSGYTYWHEIKIYEKFNLVIARNGVKKEYPLKDWANDYPADIVVSPNFDYACVTGGTSGYFGYAVLRLRDGITILDGQEYSYCDRWIDNSHVLVHEVPYFNQWTTQYYSVSTSGKRTLVSYTSRESE